MHAVHQSVEVEEKFWFCYLMCDIQHSDNQRVSVCYAVTAFYFLSSVYFYLLHHPTLLSFNILSHFNSSSVFTVQMYSIL